MWGNTRDNIQKALKNKAMPKVELSYIEIGYIREVIKIEMKDVEKLLERYVAENNMEWHESSTKNLELLKSVMNALDNPHP